MLRNHRGCFWTWPLFHQRVAIQFGFWVYIEVFHPLGVFEMLSFLRIVSCHSVTSASEIDGSVTE